jgi:hypothetical protein
MLSLRLGLSVLTGALLQCFISILILFSLTKLMQSKRDNYAAAALHANCLSSFFFSLNHCQITRETENSYSIVCFSALVANWNCGCKGKEEGEEKMASSAQKCFNCLFWLLGRDSQINTFQF